MIPKRAHCFPKRAPQLPKRPIRCSYEWPIGSQKGPFCYKIDPLTPKGLTKRPINPPKSQKFPQVPFLFQNWSWMISTEAQKFWKGPNPAQSVSKLAYETTLLIRPIASQWGPFHSSSIYILSGLNKKPICSQKDHKASARAQSLSKLTLILKKN